MLQWLKQIARITKKPRVYQVPEGLADRVCTLRDMAKHGSWVANRELWKLIEARCPEVKEGDWQLTCDGGDIYLKEGLA